jgi:hypothetical protein
MAAPTQLTISYGTSSTQTVAIPSAGGTQADYSLAVMNLVRAGGFWFTDGTGLLTFIPLSQITKITAS